MCTKGPDSEIPIYLLLIDSLIILGGCTQIQPYPLGVKDNLQESILSFNLRSSGLVARAFPLGAILPAAHSGFLTVVKWRPFCPLLMPSPSCPKITPNKNSPQCRTGYKKLRLLRAAKLNLIKNQTGGETRCPGDGGLS